MEYSNLPKVFAEKAEALNYEKPEINIDEELKSFVEGVINNPSDQQEYLIKKFVENKVELALHDWKSKYRQNDEIIQNMQSHFDSNEDEISKLESDLKDLDRSLKKIESEKYENQKNIQELESVAPSSDINKKGTLIFLIFVAFGLAILTAYKFSTAMGLITAETEGHEINTVQYILFGLGSLAILATGKIINVIYEKLHYNKKFFLSVAVLAIMFSGASAYYLASDRAFLNTKAYMIKNEKSIKKKINRLGPKSSLSPSQLKIYDNYKKEITDIQKKLRGLKDEAIGLDRIMLILILFTEMLVGGTAWMYATDYSRMVNSDKRKHTIESTVKHIKELDEKSKEIKERIASIEKNIENLRLENHDINIALSNIKTENEIENISKMIVEDETNKALSYLWRQQK